jgi:hypothetical protein
MAKQREETYYAVEGPRCVVRQCSAPVHAEVHCDDYAIALELFRGIRREKLRTRTIRDERFYVCRDHMERDQRMAKLRWQLLMFCE